MKNWNSSRNQEIKGAFVEREVVACASQLIYELNDSEGFQDNVYEEFYSTPDWELMKDNFIGNLDEDEEKEICEYFNVENITEIGEQELCEYADVDFEYLEPYEFWIVSPWLGRKLEEYGEIVSFDFFGFTIWGRCTTGQAILLDGVISRICEDLEMLED